MATRQLPSANSASLASDAVEEAPAISDAPSQDLQAFRNSREGKELLAWLKTEFQRSKDARIGRQGSWYKALAFQFGDQHVALGRNNQGLPTLKRAENRKDRRTINRVRSFARTEHSKFISAYPTVVSVPASGEDEDQRAALAAEQVWQSYQSSKQIRRCYGRTMWWRVSVGTGFIKTWWDPETKTFDGQQGDVNYANVTPFHLFVPILREKEIEQQPYVIEAQQRPLSWAKWFFKDQLAGEDLSPSNGEQLGLLDEAYLHSTQNSAHKLDQVLVLEYWVKPGATELLPNGGLIITVEDKIVHYQDSWPYAHGEFPYTKFEHVSTETFYGDTPISDIIPLQKEYNELRTQMGLATRRMGSPQLLMQEGSFDENKLTNEPGQIIKYRMGFQPPQVVQPPTISPAVMEQMDRALTDIEDLTGQHEVSKGSAPAGITAGTAMAFLKESDDNFLTPQHHDTEEGFERIAKQTLQLFVQYVDVKRKIRIVGADGSYDTELLTGADIKDGLDVRVEEGSSVGVSMAAKRAQVLELVDRGLLDQVTALKMMEIGGVQKALDIMSVAEKQAQRENVKMKLITEQQLAEHEQAFIEAVQQNAAAAAGPDEMPLDPNDPELLEVARAATPPLVPVNDFDVHEMHIEVHNRFRMSQEYENLPDQVKQQFQRHVEQHQAYLQQLQQQQAAEQAPMMGEQSDMGGEQAEAEQEAPGGHAHAETEATPPMPPA